MRSGLLRKLASVASFRRAANRAKPAGGIPDYQNYPITDYKESGVDSGGSVDSQASRIENLASEPSANSKVWKADFSELPPLDWVRASGLESAPSENVLRLDKTILGLKPTSRSDIDGTGLAECLDLFAVLFHRDLRQAAEGAHSRRPERDSASVAQSVRMFPEAIRAASRSGRLRDIWFDTDRLLRLRLENVGAAFVIRAYQLASASRAITMADEAPVRSGGPQFVDVRLIQPLAPVLIIVSDVAGVITSAGILPFPSLCRGGLHFPELLDGLPGVDYVGALSTYARQRLTEYATGLTGGFTVKSIAVDLRLALGTEPIFSLDMRQWLSTMFGVTLEPLDNTDDARGRGEAFLAEELGKQQSIDSLRIRSGDTRLCVNASSIPTLAALSHVRRQLDPKSSRIAIPFLVANPQPSGPAWRKACIPPIGGRLLHLQNSEASIPFPILDAGKSSAALQSCDAVSVSGPAWAITRRDTRFVQEANLVFPIAPDGRPHIFPLPALAGRAKRLLVIMPGRNRIRDRLRSIRRQDRQGEITPVVLVAPSSELQNSDATPHDLEGVRATPGILFSEGCQSISQAIRELDGDSVLLFAEGVVLHDRRTVNTLHAIAAQNGVATSGCALLQQISIGSRTRLIHHSAGYLPATDRANGALLRNEDAIDCLPPGTYPVAMNGPGLLYSSREAWASLDVDGRLDEGGNLLDAELAEAAAERALLHLCTSLVTAGWSPSSKPRSLPLKDSATRAVQAGSISILPVR